MRTGGKEKLKEPDCGLSTPPKTDTSRVERQVESNQLLELEDSEERERDLPGYAATTKDLQLKKVYRYWVHANSGTHLHVGIADNKAWQGWWRDIVVMPSRSYKAPSGKVGRHFVGSLVEDVHGVR